MKKIIILIAVVFIVFSCKQENKIEIGAIVPLTGPVATYGQDLKKGIDIAFNQNEDYKIIYEDDKAQATTGVSAMKKLHDINGINYFIGCATTTVSVAIAQEAQKLKSVLMVPIATGDEIKDIGDFVFMNSPRNEKQALAVFSFIIDNYSLNKTGVIYQQNAYGTGLSSVFITKMKNAGVEPLFSESYKDAKTQIRSILTKIKNTEPEIVFIPAEYEPTAIILKQAKELGLNTVFIGTDGAYSSKLIELAGNSSENFYLTMFPLDKESKSYQSFRDKYFEKYKTEPNVFTCYGYETASTLISAINNAGANPINVKDYLLNNEFQTLSGIVKFDENGEIDREYGIYKVLDKNFVIINQ